MTPSGNEPTTFRVVAQCLKKLRHRVTLVFVQRHIIFVDPQLKLLHVTLLALRISSGS